MRHCAIWIGLGGAAGTIARYLIGVAVQRAAGHRFPSGPSPSTSSAPFSWPWSRSSALNRELVSAELRLVLGTGVLGGFTTYSSFNQETLTLLARGSTARRWPT